MAYIGNFDAETIAPQTERSALPSGHYLMAITESEMKPTKNGSGQYLQLVFTVFDAPSPDAIHRKIFVRLNLINPNQTAVDLAQRELSAICHALGILKITDSAQLHDHPLCCKVQYVPAKDGYEESNKISAYRPASEYGKNQRPGTPVVPVAGPVARPVAGPVKAPWRRTPAASEAAPAA
jgi:hypothetical protein